MASNQSTGAEAMVRLLAAHGVRHIFGLCGDTSLPFYDALARLDHGMTHVLTRDERHAAYMADAYARLTHRVGICEGPSGGGATYIAPGLVEANESSVPILAITTDVATTSAGRYPLTELDQQALFRPLTKWNGAARPSRRPAPPGAPRLPRDDDRPAGIGASLPALRRAEGAGPGGGDLGRSALRHLPRLARPSRPGRGRAAGRGPAGGSSAPSSSAAAASCWPAPRPSSPGWPSASRCRSPRPSPARARSPRRTRWPSASSARTADGQRRGRSSTPRTASSSSAAAPAR